MIALLPEIIIVFAIFHLLFLRKSFSELSSRKVFNIAKTYLLLSGVCAAFFYNHKINSSLVSINAHLMFVKTVIYIYAIVWLSLSAKWYANKNENGLWFAILVLTQLLSLILMVSLINLYSIGVFVCITIVTNYYLLKLRRHFNDYIDDINEYRISGTILCICFWIGILSVEQNSAIAIILMMPAALFLLGVAPFHAGIVDMIGKAILPTSGFVGIVNIFGAFIVLNFLLTNTFAQNLDITSLIMQVCGVISIITAALYTTTQTNLRNLAAYVSVFNMGVVVITLSVISATSSIAAFTYLLLYSVSMLGILTTFFGVKKNGTYIRNLNDMQGVAYSCPFVISAFMVFLISLAGIPPIIGFWGRISVINFLVANNMFLFVIIFVLGLMILLYSFIKIIKTFYFTENIIKSYDRVDFGVYVVLFFILCFVMVTIINPTYLTNYVTEVLYKL